MKFIFLVFSFLASLPACKVARSDKVDPSLFRSSFTGYTIDGDAKVCYHADLNQCNSPSSKQAKYKSRCELAKHEVFRCDCETYLCSFNISTFEDGASLRSQRVSGYSRNGKKTSCLPMKAEVLCTSQVTEDDQYAEECVRQGYKVTQCGCHDYICAKRVTKEQ